MRIEYFRGLVKYDYYLLKHAEAEYDTGNAEIDMADALKMEVSPRPEFQAFFNETIIALKEYIDKRYGIFFGPYAQLFVKDIERRLVPFSDQNHFIEFLKMTGADEERADKNVLGVRTSSKNGSLIAFPLVAMPSEDSEPFIQKLMNEKDIGREKADLDLRVFEFQETLLHETLHLYQMPYLPGFFAETAINFYEEDFAGFLSMPDIQDEAMQRRTFFYKELINKYGDDVHKLFFGSLGNLPKQTAILSEFKGDILKFIFPRGYGLTKKDSKKFQ